MRSELTMTINQSIFSLTGSIDASNANNIQKELLSFVRQTDSDHIIINFQQVEFLDSAGLMALVAGYKEAKKLGKNYNIIRVSPVIQIIFEVSQLDLVLGVTDDLDISVTNMSQELLAA